MPRALLVNPRILSRPRGPEQRAQNAWERWQALLSAGSRRYRVADRRGLAVGSAMARKLEAAERRAGRVSSARDRAESAAPGSRLRSMKREAALAKALERRRRVRGKAGEKTAALERAHKRTLKRSRARGWPTFAGLERERAQSKPRKRRSNPMAKPRRSAAQKRATAKMIAANHRRRRGRKVRRSSSSSRPRRRNPSRVRLPARSRRMVSHAMARLVPVPVAALVRRNSKGKGHTMAKRRRRRAARTNPHKRHHRRRHNPRRHHHRRRRNPAGMGGAIRSVTSALIPAVVGGLGAGLLDATVLGGRPLLMRIGAKVILGGIGGALLRKNPVRAAAFVGSTIGTAAYEGGVRLAGGLVAHNKPAGMKELAGMAAEDEASLGLLQEELRGLGLLEERPDMLGDLEPNLGDAGEEMGDLEPSLGDYDE